MFQERFENCCVELIEREGVSWHFDRKALIVHPYYYDRIGKRLSFARDINVYQSKYPSYIEFPDIVEVLGGFSVGLLVKLPLGSETTSPGSPIWSKGGAIDYVVLREIDGNLQLELNSSAGNLTLTSTGNYCDGNFHAVFVTVDTAAQNQDAILTILEEEEITGSSTEILPSTLGEPLLLGARRINDDTFYYAKDNSRYNGFFFLQGKILTLGEKIYYAKFGLIPSNSLIVAYLDEENGDIAYDATYLDNHGRIRNFVAENRVLDDEAFSWANYFGYSTGSYTKNLWIRPFSHEPFITHYSFNGFAPTISAKYRVVINVPLGQMSIEAIGLPTFPIVSTGDAQITVSMGSLNFIGYDPAVVSSDRLVLFPSKGSMTFKGFVPTLNFNVMGQVDVPLGSMNFTGFSPTGRHTVTITPPLGELNLLSPNNPTVETPGSSVVNVLGDYLPIEDNHIIPRALVDLHISVPAIDVFGVLLEHVDRVALRMEYKNVLTIKPAENIYFKSIGAHKVETKIFYPVDGGGIRENFTFCFEINYRTISTGCLFMIGDPAKPAFAITLDAVGINVIIGGWTTDIALTEGIHKIALSLEEPAGVNLLYWVDNPLSSSSIAVTLDPPGSDDSTVRVFTDDTNLLNNTDVSHIIWHKGSTLTDLILDCFNYSFDENTVADVIWFMNSESRFIIDVIDNTHLELSDYHFAVWSGLGGPNTYMLRGYHRYYTDILLYLDYVNVPYGLSGNIIIFEPSPGEPYHFVQKEDVDGLLYDGVYFDLNPDNAQSGFYHKFWNKSNNDIWKGLDSLYLYPDNLYLWCAREFTQVYLENALDEVYYKYAFVGGSLNKRDLRKETVDLILMNTGTNYRPEPVPVQIGE